MCVSTSASSASRRQEEDKPGSEPHAGNPTVWDRRGAGGNVDYGGTRNPPRVSQERVLETLRLKLRVPQFYPDKGGLRIEESLGRERSSWK